ncbi:MAG TPA: cyanophycin synthetase [Bacteroidales bacterium]|nr:cyanophycin synthetase [Bacteroidales bacterium]
MTIETLALQGQNAIRGSMASTILARIGEIRNESIQECFRDLHCIEHRLEIVADIHGIEFINDSMATNVNSTWFALESMIRPVIWIAGGSGTCSEYHLLADLIAEKVKSVIWLGKNHEEIRPFFRALNKPFDAAVSLEDAVEQAYSKGKKGDAVLLSPGCASFGQFPDYEARGRRFRQAVKNL